MYIVTTEVVATQLQTLIFYDSTKHVCTSTSIKLVGTHFFNCGLGVLSTLVTLAMVSKYRRWNIQDKVSSHLLERFIFLCCYFWQFSIVLGLVLSRRLMTANEPGVLTLFPPMAEGETGWIHTSRVWERPVCERTRTQNTPTHTQNTHTHTRTQYFMPQNRAVLQR